MASMFRCEKEEPVRLKPIATVAGCLYLFASAHVAAAGPLSNACDLPRDLDSVVRAKYPGTNVVTPSDLNEDDKQLFQKGHADSCPGLVKLNFYGDGKPTFALALTTKSGAYPSTKLVLAHQVGADWNVVTLDKADGPVPVVWSENSGEYTGVYKDKIRATGPVVIFCGYSSWAVLYAWVNNKVAQIQLQD